MRVALAGDQMKRILNFVAIVIITCGCGARTSLSQGVTTSICHGEPPTCVAPNADDACGAASLMDAECNESSHEWLCPSGSSVYVRADSTPNVCLPFHGASSGVTALGGSLVRVPTDDGHCLWIGEDVTLDGNAQRNVAFEVDPSAPYGTCPAESITQPVPVVALAGNDPSMLVQIDGGYRLGGQTHILYRLFQFDSSNPFGVKEIGGGVAHWDPKLHEIDVPAPGSFPWGLDLDLGDAMIVQGNQAFVYGCGQPPQFLIESCSVAQLDATDSFQVVGMNVLKSGPWVSSVIAFGSGFKHVYVPGFGTDLQTHVASSVTGPWTDGVDIARCDLPTADTNAFCAGPVVHSEIADPTRTSELPITYGVGSTGTRTGNVDDYWTRLVWK